MGRGIGENFASCKEREGEASWGVDLRRDKKGGSAAERSRVLPMVGGGGKGAGKGARVVLVLGEDC